jgi:hypothetical protein
MNKSDFKSHWTCIKCKKKIKVQFNKQEDGSEQVQYACTCGFRVQTYYCFFF